MTVRLGALAMVGLAGCALTTPYAPRAQVPALARYGESVNARLEASGIPDDDAVDRVRRNQLVRELVWVIDAEYASYESSIFVGSATLDTLTDFAILGTTGAATALSAGGSLAATTVLSGMATALAGGRAAVRENFFQQQGNIALVATMRALRADALAGITKGLRQSISSYPLSRAMVDLQTYANAGSLLTALQSITNTATSTMDRSEVELRHVQQAGGDE